MQIMDVFLSMFLDGYLPIGRLDNIVGKSRLWLHTVVTQVVHLIICYSSLFLTLVVMYRRTSGGANKRMSASYSRRE